LAKPVTGRTHQFECTLNMRYPIVGDEKYHGRIIKRNKALGFKRFVWHATRLELMLNGDVCLFEAPKDKRVAEFDDNDKFDGAFFLNKLLMRFYNCLF